MDDIKNIQDERQGDYGDAKESHQAIANSWSVYLSRKLRTEVELEAKDVAILMVLFKSMREAYKHKYDNLLDMASYADFARSFCEDTIHTPCITPLSPLSKEFVCPKCFSNPCICKKTVAEESKPSSFIKSCMNCSTCSEEFNEACDECRGYDKWSPMVDL